MADDIKEKVLHVFDLLDKKMINTRIARSVTAEIFDTGKSADDIIINRPLNPCCVPADVDFVKYSDDLIAKVFKEYPEILDSFKRNADDARSRITWAALRACDDGDVKCSINDLIQAADRYINKSKETENVESQS
jgi:hypothetical protein